MQHAYPTQNFLHRALILSPWYGDRRETRAKDLKRSQRRRDRGWVCTGNDVQYPRSPENHKTCYKEMPLPTTHMAKSCGWGLQRLAGLGNPVHSDVAAAVTASVVFLLLRLCILFGVCVRGLAMLLRLASKLRLKPFSCLGLLSAATTAMCHCAQLNLTISFKI